MLKCGAILLCKLWKINVIKEKLISDKILTVNFCKEHAINY